MGVAKVIQAGVQEAEFHFQQFQTKCIHTTMRKQSLTTVDLQGTHAHSQKNETKV